MGGSLFLLCLPFSGIGAGILLFFVGFFNGPVYPNLMHLVPQLFGREKAQSLMGSFLAFACLGITLAPPLFGLLASRLGFGVFAFGLLAVFFRSVSPSRARP